MVSQWIQKSKEGMKKGSLHRQLGIPEEQKITDKMLRGIIDTPVGNMFRGHSVTKKLKSRALWACNVRKSCREGNTNE
jgi:hypothetical protein